MLNLDSIKADQWLSCFLAVDATKSCIHIWNEKRPKDEGPNKAIEAAEAWLSNPCKETAAYAANAYTAAYAAAAYAAANAYYTAYAAAAYAAYAAYAAAYAAYAAAYAYNAVSYASKALEQNKEEYINNLLHKHLSFIIDYKIKNNQSFGDFEAIFEAASEKDKEKLLFHFNLSDKE